MQCIHVSLLACCLTVVLLHCLAAPSPGCSILIDQSCGLYHGLTSAPSYATFWSMLSSNGIVITDNQMAPLSVVNYEGVGIFWIDAVYSNTTYSINEVDVIYHFVRVSRKSFRNSDRYELTVISLSSVERRHFACYSW